MAITAEAPGLEIDVADRVVTATIDRGDDRNLLTMPACRALIALLDDPPEDVHLLRLRARGPVFCLGREREADAPAGLRGESETLVGLNRALRDSPLVTVAEVGGDAAGFGVGLAALADVAIADPGARFWFPEVRIDLAPAVVLAWLPRVVGRKQAFWLTATGKAIDADRAAALGLLTAVSRAGGVEAAVDDAVAELIGHSRRVHVGIKQLLATMGDMTSAGADAFAAERLIIGSMSRSSAGEHR